MKYERLFRTLRSVFILLAAVIATAAPAQSSSSDAHAPIRGLDAPDRIPGEYIVVLRDDVVQEYLNVVPDAGRVEVLSTLIREIISSRDTRVGFMYAYALAGFSLRDTAEATAARLARDPAVAYVTVNQSVTLDSHGGTQSPVPSWGLDRIDQHTLPLNNSFTWRNPGTGVHVYVIDTGINPDPEFGERLRPGVDLSPSPPPSCPECFPCPGCEPQASGFGPDSAGDTDCNGHGTHVAGTIGSTTYGVAKDVYLYPVRIFGCDDGGFTTGGSDEMIAGMDWVANNHNQPAVANMSFGGTQNDAIDEAAGNLMDLGVVLVASAGNKDEDACTQSPAGAQGMITVAASDIDDRRAQFTPTAASNWGPCVDFFAPGKGIVSVPTDGGSGGCADGTCSGTSMAAPHAAGVAAQLKSENPSITQETVSLYLSCCLTTDDVITNPGAGSPNKLLHVWKYHGE